MKTIEDKRQKEKEIVSLMIKLYCKKKHGGNKLCNKCKKLQDYANGRVEKCPFMEDKTFCANCKVHCYSPSMKEEIRKVMRFSGPRMLLYHPILAISHVIETKKEKRKQTDGSSSNDTVCADKIKCTLFIILGCLNLAIAVIGVVLPLLPTFPFACLTAYFFGKSSKKLDDWFKKTKIYKNYIESFVKGEGLTIKIKIKIILMITILLTIGFLNMGNVPIGRIILFFIWLFHIYYFIFRVKTRS